MTSTSTHSRMLLLVPALLISLTFSNILWIGVYSIFPWVANYFFIQFAIYLISISFSFKYFFKTVSVNFKVLPLHYVLLVILLLFSLLRSPMIYPTYDDFVSHYLSGTLAYSLWDNYNFMPLSGSTYLPPFYDMNYSFFLNNIGIRATILLFDSLLSIWLVSLLSRFHSITTSKTQQIVLFVIFISAFFYPHLSATHGTLMTDYVAMVIGIETIYLLAYGKNTATLGVIMAIMTLMIKQSTGIFLIPIFIYYTLKNIRVIKWREVFFVVFVSSIYFIKLWMITGNPLFGLFNSIFRSSLYSISSNDFKNTLFGPINAIQTLLWPVIAQYTNRYGEGIVALFPKIFFSWVSICGYIGSIYLVIRHRSLKYLSIFIAYIFWSILAGYSRYYTSLNPIALIIMSMDIKVKYPKVERAISKYKLYIVGSIIIFSLSSIKTDFSWRPYPSFRTPASNVYFLSKYSEGLGLLFQDTLPALSSEVEPVFRNFDAVVVAFRGQSTMLGFLASKLDLPVYNGITNIQLNDIISDTKVSGIIKRNLVTMKTHKNIILLVDEEYKESISSLTLMSDYHCSDPIKSPISKYLQREYFYTNVLTYNCTKIES